MFSILLALWLYLWQEQPTFSNMQGSNLVIQGTGTEVHTQTLTIGTAASSTWKITSVK